MPRFPHGRVLTPVALEEARRRLVEVSASVEAGYALTRPVDLHDFDFMFPDLQGERDLLPRAADTPEKLKVLGRTMEDTGGADPGDSSIPAAYTYFGQFVDHDVTFEVQPADLPPSASGSVAALLDPAMRPLSLAQIRNALRNFRTATLDLDSVYGLPAPRDPDNGAKMRIGQVTPLGLPGIPTGPVPGKGPDHDLPREPPSGDILHDRAALIGDPRNDENLIVAQLHLAFLKAHNALVDQGRTFEEAQRLLRQHYQHIVIHDHLKRSADPAIVDDILENGNRFYDAAAAPFFMPLEFAVAAYRFGHTMVRGAYTFNVNFRPATIDQLFTFTALSGELGGTPTLPENWVIQWENIIDAGTGGRFDRTRRLDTKLASPGLFQLHDLQGQTETPPDAAILSVRNLLRGYRLRIPTGQAIARFIGSTPLTPAELEAAAADADQVQALRAGGFLERTPLWYYLLAEAKHHGAGNRLGPVGSTIIAEVLIALVRRSADSILRSPGWRPSLGSRSGEFELADLLRLAGVLPDPTPPRTYTVRSGDTLSGIARDQLGDAARWPEIFALNRGIIRHPDRIFPGQVLVLPSDTRPVPAPRIYVVRRGDTLSGIAQAQLGAANRWPEIFALNRDVVSNPDRIFPGQVLVLPD
jgi:nucleoid-associated protein YgaU